MKPNRIRQLALCVGLAVALPAWSIDLLQAYESALAQDALVRAARAAADAGRERLPQARAQLLPNLSYSATRNSNNLERSQPNSVGLPTTFKEKYFSGDQTLTLRQPLFRGTLIAGYQQAKFVVDDVNAVLDRELQNLGSRVAGAYLEALLAADQLQLVQAQKAFTTTVLDVAKKAFAAGSGIRTDIDDAQSRLDMTLALELEAKQNLEFTRQQLKVLVNGPIDRLAPLDVSKLPLVIPAPARMDDWIQRAEEKNPEIVSLKARVDIARAEVSKAQAAHYPTLDAVAQLIDSQSQNTNTPSTGYTNKTIGVQLFVPLYAGGYVNSTVRQALAELQRAEEQLEASRRELGLRVQKEYRNVSEGIERVKALEQAARSSEQLVISSRKSFQAGTRTLVDILNAEQQLQLALRDLAQTRYLFVMARIRLFALAGADARDSIVETNAWLGG